MSYPDSWTEHDLTPMTLSTMLSADVSRAAGLVGVELKRELRRLMGEAPAFAKLREAGYEWITVRSPIVHVSGSGWDQTIDSGQINDFEVVLLSRLRGGWLLRDWVLQQHRERIFDGLAVARSLAEPAGQHAVLIHLMSPHPPFLFAAAGGAADPSACWPVCGLYASRVERHPLGWDGYRAAFVSQVEALNALVSRTLEVMIERDPDGVVVVMSDHGSRYSDDDTAEWHANLFAARTPGHPTMFGSAPTPAWLFERILASYSDGVGLE